MKTCKKICAAAFLLLLLLLPVFTVCADEASPLLTLKANSVQNFENGKDAVIELHAVNTTSEPQPAVFVTALYEAETGKMLSYTFLETTAAPDAAFEWGAGMTIPAAGSYTVKAFALRDFESAQSLSNTVVLNMGDEPETDLAAAVKNAMQKTGAFLTGYVKEPTVGVYGGEWTIIGLSRAGYKVPDGYYEGYLAKAVSKVAEEAAKQERVWDNKITEVQRVALAFTSLGVNPQDIDGVDLLDYSYNKSKHFPGLSAPGNTLGGRQGCNELIYALLSVGAHDGFTVPAQSETDVNAMITDLLAYQDEDGGFSLAAGGTPDADVTAMAVQALAGAADRSDALAAAERALAWLSSRQTDDGMIENKDDNGKPVKTAETVSQVIIALTELGLDPAADSRFIKNGTSLIDALFALALDDGSFRHTPSDTEMGLMATEQAMCALAALNRFYEKENTLYDMNDALTVEHPLPLGTVTLSMEKRVIGKGDVVSPCEVPLYEGDTVQSVVKRMAAEKGIDIEYVYSEQYDFLYISAIDGDGEFDHGSLSGWMYLINDEFPPNDIARQTLNVGDVLRFCYQVSGWGTECTEPLARYLKQLISDTETQLAAGNYTPETQAAVETALAEARILADDPAYDVRDTDKELEVSERIAAVNAAVARLEESTPLGTVTLSMEKRVIGKGDVVSPCEVPLYEGDTVQSVVKRMAAEKGIDIEYVYSEQYDFLYISAIDGDGEFDHGSLSGWMYLINDEFPPNDIARQTLNVGDVLRFCYQVSGWGTECTEPLARYLKQLISDTETQLAAGNYTPETQAAVETALAEARILADDPAYDVRDTDKELEVSERIAAVNAAVAQLAEAPAKA